MSQSFNIEHPRNKCNFTFLWLNLYIYSRNLTCERIIYKFIVYGLYICGILSLIYILINDYTKDGVVWWIYPIQGITLLTGLAGVIDDCMRDLGSSPLEEFCNMVCKKNNQNDTYENLKSEHDDSRV